jgi:CRISPR-associated endonuclease/helicase Cas3
VNSADFPKFYEAVHGRDREPFPWQERLAAQVLAGEWPGTIAVPTGCGKTSVVDIAVFALATQAGLPARQRTARLRIFFVVDRRLVVDDVSRHVKKIAEAIEGGGTEELRWVREQLLRFGAPCPLQTAVLRGGMYRSNTWADAPNQPLVCVSTVDQVGSRLLFRGYGVSEGRRPVDAGLVGNDSLLIVDEAHLSRPFLDTLGWVQRYQGNAWRGEKPAPGLRFVQMSATVRDEREAFRLEQGDFESEALKPRLEAEKIAELKEVSNLPQAAAEEAVRLANAGAGVVGVVLNTVAAARATFEALASDGGDRILLTGRVRPYDRDRLLETHLDRMKAWRQRRDGERFFVVATQTVEVGADLDFDALVTEAASLDALRQRFGRLNRLGDQRSARAAILRAKRAKEKDWIYGDALENTWKWLNEQATGGLIDFGVAKMGDLFRRLGNDSLMVAPAEGPLLFPAHLDAWAQTNPAPAADPDVAPFLHGVEALETADVQIVWRADLESAHGSDWMAMLEAVPPLSTEAMPVPIRAARRWLELESTGAAVADVEGVAPAEEHRRAAGERLALIWRGPGPERSTTDLWSLRPGDTVVVRASEGGCDTYGWDPGSDVPVRDVGDLCANRRARDGGGKYRIRAHPKVLFPADEDGKSRDDLEDILKRVATDEDGATEELKALVERAASGEPDLMEAAKILKWGRDAKAYGPTDSGWLLGESKRTKPRAEWRSLPELDEADEDDSSSLTSQTTLKDHTGGVVAKVRKFTDGCGLDQSVAATLMVAAELHDLGKWDERFQELLDPLRDSELEPLAKGDGRSRRGVWRLLGRDQYPKGARHEFASAALAEARALWPDGCDSELALYLIGTHHGFGRPFAPVWLDGDYAVRARIEGREIAVRGVHRVAGLDSGWTERYWALTRKYGWWGLAYLEAILRRADCVRSREEEEMSNESH